MKRENHCACPWLVVATVANLVFGFRAVAQECSSPTLTFAGQFPIGPEISISVGTGYALAEHEVANIQSVTVKPTATDLPMYIVATLANGKLTIRTNDLFAIYEKLDDKLLFLNIVVFTCTSGALREMTFRQNIKEENNHTPLFSQEEYAIAVPLPLPRDFNIQQFVDDGKGVLGNDYDITKNKITFSIEENDYFRVVSSDGSSRTEFLANLITTQTLTKIQPSLSLQITAKDAWDPPRTSQARLTISGDPVIVFITPPEFEQSLYKTSYKVGNSFTPFRVSLMPETYDLTVQYKVDDGEDVAFFNITPSADRGSATVSLRSGAQIGDGKTILSATLSATRTGADNIGRTAFVMELINEPIMPPTFEETLYTGAVASDGNIILNATIKLIPATSGTDVQVQLKGDDAKYFTATLNSNQVAFAPSPLLTAAVLKERNFFAVVVQAAQTSVGVGETLLVLAIEKTNLKTPHFEQLVYEGTITESGVLNVPTVKISPGSFVDGLALSYSGDVALFVFNSSPEGIISIVPNNITTDKLDGKSYLLLSVTGKLEDIETTHAVIIFRVLRATVVLPKFTKAYLEGQLLEKTLEVRLPNVEIDGESFSSSTEVHLIDELGFFDIQEYFPANVFKVFLRSTVTSGSLRGIKRIPLTVEARNPNSEIVYCVITIDVMQTIAPTFERLIYDGLIDESKQLVEPLIAKLTPESIDETVQYSLEGNDASFFLWEFIELTMGGVNIKLKDALTENEFESRDSFQLNLRATKQQAAGDAIVPVVVYVKRPLVKIPKFEKPLYKSRVNTDLQLLPFEAIILERGSYLDAATISLTHSNTDLFVATLWEGAVTVRLLKELDPATVNAMDRFEFVVECKNPNMGSGFTTILVDIDRAVEPEFSELFYMGNIDEDSKEIVFDQKISLKTGTTVSGTVYSIQGVDKALLRYEEVADNSLNFFIRDEVTVEQLEGRSEISFLVLASNPHSSKPSVASFFVKIVRKLHPSFTQSSFQGKIVEGQTAVDFGDAPITWETGTVTGSTNFTILAAPPADLFEVIVREDLSAVTILLRSDVKWDQVRSRVYFKFILQASNPGVQPTQCTLVVDVENQPTVTPMFTKSIYRGSLQEGTKDVIFSAAETITVDPETIMPTFQYVVSEGDAILFNVLLVDGNKLKVSLKEAIISTVIEGRDMLSFIVNINNAYSAVDTATVVVTIKLHDIVSPAFAKLVYAATLHETTNELCFEETILLIAGTFTEYTNVGLGGTHAGLLNVTRVGSHVQLTLKNPVNWPAIPARYLSVYIQATNPDSDTATAFVVISIEAIQQPQFARAAVHGSIETGSRQVLFMEGSELKIVFTTTEPGFQWNLAGVDYQLFDGTLNDDLFTFSLKSSVTQEQLGSRSLFEFSVILKNPTKGTVESSVIVNRKLPIPLFTKALYYGSFDGDLRLTLMELIQITEGSFSPGTIISIKETNVDFFYVEQTDRSVQVKLSRSLTLEDFQGIDVVHLVLEASNGEDIQSTCGVFLNLPLGTPCIPLPPIVDCSSCYNCTTGGVQENVPVFAYGNFRFQIRSDTSGPIGSVTATVKDPMAIVQHQLEVTDEYLQRFLYLTGEGTLSLVQPIVPNVYNFLVHATNVRVGKQSSASVQLTVLSDYECTEGDKKVTVEQVLLVKHLDEERPHLTIFPTRVDSSCSYELLSESPTDAQRPYFYINTETNWLTTRSFDREDRNLFRDFVVPQFRVLMKLQCHGKNDHNFANVGTGTRSLVKRSLVETDTINYAPDITVISIIVDDINDNDPVFVQPLVKHVTEGETIHLAYPEPSLASRLMLAHLTTVQATDADEGLNAKIRYSLAEENGHFVIDPEAGTIHPTRDALREVSSVEFTVFASDRDGAIDGHRTGLALTVHRLEDDRIAIVTLVMSEETTLEDVIVQINRQENFHLHLLHHAYVPMPGRNTQKINKHQLLNRQSAMRLVVFALDNTNQPMNTDTIRNGIRKAIPTIDRLAIVSFADAICYADENQTDPSCPEGMSARSSNASLIASTSVLGALLLISLAIGSVLYVRYVRPLSKNTNDPSDIVQLENDFDHSPPSTPPTKREQKRAQEEVVQDRKISINIAGITMQESEDVNGDGKRLARSLSDRLYEEEEYGAALNHASDKEMASLEPKNVKFNEVVERIEVQESHSDQDDDGEENSVYEERL